MLRSCHFFFCGFFSSSCLSGIKRFLFFLRFSFRFSIFLYGFVSKWIYFRPIKKKSVESSVSMRRDPIVFSIECERKKTMVNPTHSLAGLVVSAHLLLNAIHKHMSERRKKNKINKFKTLVRSHNTKIILNGNLILIRMKYHDIARIYYCIKEFLLKIHEKKNKRKHQIETKRSIR